MNRSAPISDLFSRLVQACFKLYLKYGGERAEAVFKHGKRVWNRKPK